MNKKTYMQPAIQMVATSMQQMICGSTNDSMQVKGKTNNASDLLSRDRSNLWDDED